MSVFKKLEEVPIKTVEDDEVVEDVVEEEITYIEKEVKKKKIAFALTAEEKEAIYEIVKRDIVEDDLFSFIEKKPQDQQRQLFEALITSDQKKQMILDSIEDEKDRIVKQNLDNIMEASLVRSFPVKYESEGGATNESTRSG